MATTSTSAHGAPAAAYRYAHTWEWHRLGAEGKAANVVALCSGIPHASILEIGAGDGAVLARLAELGFGSELHALEVSASGVAVTRARGIAGLAEARLFDGVDVPFPDGRFDLAVLSHVVEHADDPRQLLREAARVARSVFVEVPLEDTWRLPRDFAPDAVGHINFYSRKGLRRFVQTCGLEVFAERVVNPPLATYQHRAPRTGSGRYWTKQIALWLAPALATHLFTYHGSLLCRRPAPASRPAADL
jgi:SAM-dependent methyltransferase